jgi:nitroreductase
MASLSEVVRTRRTTKAFGSEPLDRATLEELLDLARWAPNHHLTNPWRFRVLGPQALARLKDAAGPEAGAKLDRAPTLVAVSALQHGEGAGGAIQDEEDLLATGCAAYLVLLGAQERGLAGYWRTPAVLRSAEGRAALGIPDDERPIGLLHLGPRRQDQPAPERAPLADVLSWLD